MSLVILDSFCNCSCGLTDIFSPFPKKQWILKVQKEMLEHVNFSLIALKVNVHPLCNRHPKPRPLNAYTSTDNITTIGYISGSQSQS